METKHTKGKWQILWNNYTHFATINTDIKTRICAIEIEDSKQIEEKTANAKLIAAAPDLLVAMQHILRDVAPIIHKMPVKNVYSQLISLNEGLKAIHKATK